MFSKGVICSQHIKIRVQNSYNSTLAISPKPWDIKNQSSQYEITGKTFLVVRNLLSETSFIFRARANTVEYLLFSEK